MYNAFHTNNTPETNTKNKKKFFSSYIQYFRKYSCAGQQLAYRGWHQVSRQGELLTGGGRGGGRHRTEESSTIGDGGQVATCENTFASLKVPNRKVHM